MGWIDLRVRTVELLPNLFNRVLSAIVPVDVEEVLQNFKDNPQLDNMPVLLAGQVYPGTETDFVRMFIVVSRGIKNPTTTTGMILAPDRKNQIRAIRSAGFEANLQLPIDRYRVQFCMSYHLRGHCNDNCTRKAWHRALTTTEIAQLNKFLGQYVATPSTSGPTTPSNM